VTWRMFGLAAAVPNFAMGRTRGRYPLILYHLKAIILMDCTTYNKVDWPIIKKKKTKLIGPLLATETTY
jgi:hypothetical protein